MKTQSKRYQELDALRGIAAIMVVLFHFTIGRPFAKLGFELGTTGVDLFFIISGFVIFMSLTKIETSVDFIINRVSRLYPAYWACVSFTFVLVIFRAMYNHTEISMLQYFGNMTMIQFYLGIPDLDGPYWTMIIEMIFYILILILFKFKLLRFLDIICITISTLIVIFVVIIDHKFVIKLIDVIPFFQFIPLFYAGTVFYKIQKEKKDYIIRYGILILCLLFQVLLFNHSGRSHSYITQNQYAMMLIIYFILFTLFINNKLKFIISVPSLFLGKISFALYLIHQYISLDLIIPILVNKLKVNFWIASICISLPVVIILATFVTYYVEMPLTKKLKYKLQSLSKSA